MYPSRAGRNRLRTMALTGPMAGADIDRLRTPTPNKAMASRGRPAISPQTDKGTPATRHCCARDRRKAQHRRRQSIVTVGDAQIAAIGGEQKLCQIIGSDRQKIDALQQSRHLPGERRHFQHRSHPHPIGHALAVRLLTLQFQIEDRPQPVKLRDLGHHWEHHVQITADRGLNQGTELLAEDGRAVQTDADRPPAHGRIVPLSGSANKAEACRNRHPACETPPACTRLIENFRIKTGLRRHIRQLRARHERHFRAVKANAIGPRRIQVRQIDLQAGIQHHADRLTAPGDRRQVTHRGETRHFFDACDPDWPRMPPEYRRSADEDLAVITIDDDDIQGVDFG